MPPTAAADQRGNRQGSRRVAVLGSTGSIGRNAIDVIQASQGRLKATVLSAHSRLDRLVEQAQALKPKFIVAADSQAAAEHAWKKLPKSTELLVGPAALEQAAGCDEVDTVLAAIVGSAGARSTIAALQANKTVALANKETLVTAGPIVRAMLDERQAADPNAAPQLLPVDSEHSAVFQSLACGDREEVERIVLTASGGPFRTWSREHLAQVTVDEALAHPTWEMGPKITIDSATMMNKALEVIEARWLFDIPAEKIRVMIHPQSVIHSMVEFVDGSVVAQLGPPDMKLPIQHALDYPHRLSGPANRLDWTQAHDLRFEPADFDRFPALELGFQCARDGGTSGAVLNAANEGAVQSFLDGELHFTEIVPACRSILEAHNYEPNPSLERLEELDTWARQEIHTWVCALTRGATALAGDRGPPPASPLRLAARPRRSAKPNSPDADALCGFPGRPWSGLRDLRPRAWPLRGRQMVRRAVRPLLCRVRRARRESAERLPTHALAGQIPGRG